MSSTVPLAASLICTDSFRPVLGQSRKYSARSCAWPSVRLTLTVKLVPLLLYQAAAARLPVGLLGFCGARVSVVLEDQVKGVALAEKEALA